MPKYVIEREIPGAGQFTPQKLKEISQVSNNVLVTLGSEIQWVHSYVTGNKVYCIYNAANEEIVRKHASQSGFPADVINRVSAVIDTVTAE
ncbi:DUF4242 domain-containing protein [Polluticoccus soli]|uniref:DUF4242 domain-containing protein n=1 Tax=Polluticoccus soli TaxID=3034150 RepID=UPI0023E132A9|nr:DUF4242 domain-containing protein [Flavipsychrobacter sp. JY13-12]